MAMKKTALLILALVLSFGTLLVASADTPTAIPSHTVTLEGCTIGEGEIVTYTTVSSEFANAQLPEGFYAGELTLEITGPIVVERGGTLGIGTLSIGSDSEASPVLCGTLSEIPLIVVKSGGRLILTDVILDTSGEGLLILQEPGSSISLTATQLPPDIVQWAPPTVNNLHDAPDDLWLEEGTPLTASLLPSVLTSNLQEQGQEERVELPLCWDLSDYDGRTTGELTLTGAFLDDSGTRIPSMLPVTTTVHWYQPEELVVTDVIWKGTNACSAHFTLLQVPEHAQITGEISTDGGTTWEVWTKFDTGEDDQGAVICNFYEVANTPQSYRIVATDPQKPAFWISKVFLLPLEEEEDSGGNRGGSTTPVTPDREPTPPESQPSQEPQPSDEPQPTPTPFRPSTNSTVLDAIIASEPEQTPAPEATPSPLVTTAPELTPAPSATVAPEPSTPPQPTTLSSTMQVVLVAGGIVVCAVLGIWIARKRGI